MAVENQHLKHGKPLCGKVFANFVETFNALVDFMNNFKGDADGKDGEGHITFDCSEPSHPVVRCAGCGGGDGSVTAVGTDGSSASGTKLVFATAEDSNIEVKITTGDDGSVIVTIGAYYK